MTKQELIDKGYDDTVVFENPDFDGCIVGVTTDRIAVYSLKKWLNGIQNGVNVQFRRQ